MTAARHCVGSLDIAGEFHGQWFGVSFVTKKLLQSQKFCRLCDTDLPAHNAGTVEAQRFLFESDNKWALRVERIKRSRSGSKRFTSV